MTSTCLPRPIPLTRPWALRWGAALADALRAGARWAWARWQRAATRTGVRWEPGMLASLDERTLRDIGVPDWAREEVAQRRESERLALDWHAGIDSARRSGW